METAVVDFRDPKVTLRQRRTLRGIFTVEAQRLAAQLKAKLDDAEQYALSAGDEGAAEALRRAYQAADMLTCELSMMVEAV